MSVFSLKCLLVLAIAMISFVSGYLVGNHHNKEWDDE
jgi:hypothetical protein